MAGDVILEAEGLTEEFRGFVAVKNVSLAVRLTGSRPSQIASLGLVRSFQISAVFPHLSVLENVRIALQRRRGRSFDFWRAARVLEGLNGKAGS